MLGLLIQPRLLLLKSTVLSSVLFSLNLLRQAAAREAPPGQAIRASAGMAGRLICRDALPDDLLADLVIVRGGAGEPWASEDRQQCLA